MRARMLLPPKAAHPSSLSELLALKHAACLLPSPAPQTKSHPCSLTTKVNLDMRVLRPCPQSQVSITLARSGAPYQEHRSAARCTWRYSQRHDRCTTYVGGDTATILCGVNEAQRSANQSAACKHTNKGRRAELVDCYTKTRAAKRTRQSPRHVKLQPLD